MVARLPTVSLGITQTQFEPAHGHRGEEGEGQPVKIQGLAEEEARRGHPSHEERSPRMCRPRMPVKGKRRDDS
jgi:hypothetical protein